MFSKVKNIIIVFLLGILVLTQISANLKDREIEKLNIENVKLNEKIKSRIQIDKNNIKIVYRYKDKIKYRNIYIPPESTNTTITTDKDDNIKINYSKFGTGFYPFIGAGYSSTFKPLIGARLLYVHKFGMGISTSFDSTNLFIDMRTSLGKFENTSFGVFYNSKDVVGIGVHVFL